MKSAFPVCCDILFIFCMQEREDGRLARISIKWEEEQYYGSLGAFFKSVPLTLSYSAPPAPLRITIFPPKPLMLPYNFKVKVRAILLQRQLEAGANYSLTLQQRRRAIIASFWFSNFQTDWKKTIPTIHCSYAYKLWSLSFWNTRCSPAILSAWLKLQNQDSNIG